MSNEETRYQPARGIGANPHGPCEHCGQIEQQHWSDGVCFTTEELGDRMTRKDFAPGPDGTKRRRGR